MIRELVIFLLMYGVILAGHAIHTRWQRWAERRQPRAVTQGVGVRAWIRRHVVALVLATVTHPATHATFKDYALHLVIDSGYVFAHSAPH
jgi:hypothetical protein